MKRSIVFHICQFDDTSSQHSTWKFIRFYCELLTFWSFHRNRDVSSVIVEKLHSPQTLPENSSSFGSMFWEMKTSASVTSVSFASIFSAEFGASEKSCEEMLNLLFKRSNLCSTKSIWGKEKRWDEQRRKESKRWEERRSKPIGD